MAIFIQLKACKQIFNLLWMRGARQFVHTTFRTKIKTRHFVQKAKPDILYKKQNPTFRAKMKPDISYKKNKDVLPPCFYLYLIQTLYGMSGFVFVPIVRVRNVGFLAIVRNVFCSNCRGAALGTCVKTKTTVLVSTFLQHLT